MNHRKVFVLLLTVLFGCVGIASASNSSSDDNLAKRLEKYLEAKRSPLSVQATVFVSQGKRYGVDPRLVVAISGAETAFGRYGPCQKIRNPFGMGPGFVYPSWRDAIESATKNLAGSLYKGSGLNTISSIQKKWAPDATSNDPSKLNHNWTRNVKFYYSELGGNPEGNVFIVPEGVTSPRKEEVEAFTDTILLGLGSQDQARKAVDKSSTGGPLFLIGCLVFSGCLIIFSRRREACNVHYRRRKRPPRRF